MKTWPTSADEERDTPPVTVDLIYITGVILLVLGLATGTALGSWLLHTWDAEIRHGLAWAGEQLVRLYWAALSVHG